MTKQEIFINLTLTILVGIALQMFSNEINLITPIIKENLFEILVLAGIGIIIKILVPSNNKQ